MKILIKYYDNIFDVAFSVLNLLLYTVLFERIIKEELLIKYLTKNNISYGKVLAFTNNFGLYFAIFGIALSVARIFKDFDKQTSSCYNYLFLLIMLGAHIEFTYALLNLI